MTNFASPHIYAVIVTYDPDLSALAELLNPLLPQVAGIVVVDNGSSNAAALRALLDAQNTSTLIHLIALESNQGIAAAQNRGIEHVQTQRADFVLLFDQDSIPAHNMVAELLEVYDAQTARGVKVAAIGPYFYDEAQQNHRPFLRGRGFVFERKYNISKEKWTKVDFLIASGSMIPMHVITEVGLMKEDLFIEYVDIEWCIRASMQGWQSYGAFHASMRHTLGDQPIRILGKRFMVHSPIRHYYLYRNAVVILGDRYCPWVLRIQESKRLVMMFGFYALFAPPRLQHIQMMLRGLWHGITGQMGAYKTRKHG